MFVITQPTLIQSTTVQFVLISSFFLHGNEMYIQRPGYGYRDHGIACRRSHTRPGIQQYLRQESLESPLNEQRLLDAWPQVLGPAASYTSNLYIRNQTLYVHLTSAALRQELMMGRELLVRTLNQRVGATVITNIIFR